MQIVLETVLVVLAIDFVSGVLRWLEDSYGDPQLRITPVTSGHSDTIAAQEGIAHMVKRARYVKG